MSELLKKHGFSDSNRLDHGELSIPSRLANINAQIDSYKRDKARIDAKVACDTKFINSERIRESKDKAWIAYEKYGAAFIEHYESKIKASGYSPKTFVEQEARERPDNFLLMINKFNEE